MLNEYLNNLIYQMAYKSNSSSGVGCSRTAVAKAYKIGSLTKQRIVATYSRQMQSIGKDLRISWFSRSTLKENTTLISIFDMHLKGCIRKRDKDILETLFHNVNNRIFIQLSIFLD